jgi:hypothetical protein
LYYSSSKNQRTTAIAVLGETPEGSSERGRGIYLFNLFLGDPPVSVLVHPVG